jgi:hypothetical protein
MLQSEALIKIIILIQETLPHFLEFTPPDDLCLSIYDDPNTFIVRFLEASQQYIVERHSSHSFSSEAEVQAFLLGRKVP